VCFSPSNIINPIYTQYLTKYCGNLQAHRHSHVSTLVTFLNPHSSVKSLTFPFLPSVSSWLTALQMFPFCGAHVPQTPGLTQPTLSPITRLAIYSHCNFVYFLLSTGNNLEHFMPNHSSGCYNSWRPTIPSAEMLIRSLLFSPRPYWWPHYHRSFPTPQTCLRFYLIKW
jgi:hypothetical protein